MIHARRIQILALVFLLAYLGIALAATWWALSGPSGIVQRADNPRRALVGTATAPTDSELQLTPGFSIPGA